MSKTSPMLPFINPAPQKNPVVFEQNVKRKLDLKDNGDGTNVFAYQSQLIDLCSTNKSLLKLVLDFLVALIERINIEKVEMLYIEVDLDPEDL